MKIRSLIVALVVSFLPVVASAQNAPEVLVALDAAIASGNLQVIDSIVAANVSNPAVIAQIASRLLAAAQALKASNPTLSAMMAATSVASGGLTGSNAVIALNIVVSNPAALALLTNPNAPSFTANFFASLAVPNRPSGVAHSGIQAAENSAQYTGSAN